MKRTGTFIVALMAVIMTAYAQADSAKTDSVKPMDSRPNPQALLTRSYGLWVMRLF